MILTPPERYEGPVVEQRASHAAPGGGELTATSAVVDALAALRAASDEERAACADRVWLMCSAGPRDAEVLGPALAATLDDAHARQAKTSTGLALLPLLTERLLGLGFPWALSVSPEALEAYRALQPTRREQGATLSVWLWHLGAGSLGFTVGWLFSQLLG